MLSPADMVIIGAAALIVFGPEQLPKVARRAGQIVRDVQNTSHTFIREMERAADEPEHDAWQTAPHATNFGGPDGAEVVTDERQPKHSAAAGAPVHEPPA